MSRTPRTWTVRPGTVNDSPALRQLFTVVFGHDRGEAHHSWKFDANPAGQPVLAVAEDGGKIVGQYALWPVELAVGSEVVLGAQSLDTMTHPDYRGQGMFTTLAKEAMIFAADRGVEVLFGFPNAASHPGFVNKLDWDHTGDVRHHSRVLRPSAHPRVPEWAGRGADLAARLIPSGPRGGARVVPADPETLAALHAEHGTTEGCRVDRTSRYLTWRLAPGFGREYEWIAVGDGGRPDALAVWGRDVATDRAVLAELVGNSPHAMSVALAAVIARAADDGRRELVAMSHRAGMSPLLRRAGFISRSSLPLIVRKLTTRVIPGNVHRHDTWSVFGSDLDTF